MAKVGKRFLEAKKKVNPEMEYSPREALALVKEAAWASFDESVDVSIRLGVDARHADQQVRGTVVLPHGTGKSVRIAVFARGDQAREAEAAGADLVGADDLVTKVEQGLLDFDMVIATPDMMAQVGRLGRVLGPKGLMPNPKAGTVTFDVGKAVSDFKAGKVEYRVGRDSNMHVALGKVSFSEDALLDNFRTLMDAIVKARPAAAKGQYLRRVTVSSTMGPGIRVEPYAINVLVAE